MTVRIELEAWVNEQLTLLNISKNQFDPILGDAGFREYFRLQTTPALLAVYGPPNIEKHAQFAAISEHWRSFGISAPKVYASDFNRGFLLIEDFGTYSLADDLRTCSTLTDVSSAYESSFKELKQLQLLSPIPIYPEFDRALFLQELQLFGDWFVAQLLQITLTEDEINDLERLYNRVIDELLLQPRTIVHRDFHCRNIQKVDEGVGLIDFQDAVIGPVTYDVVSLLKDCYQLWPTRFIQSELVKYRSQLPAPLAMSSELDFVAAFHLMGWQRHMKVLGIFARLSLRDHKPRYLNDLPRVMAYTRAALHECPILQPFEAWFNQRIFTLAESQPWFSVVEIQQ